METAKAFGYRLHEWESEHLIHRAEMIAHEIERNLREGYRMEKAREKSSSNEPDVKNNSFFAMQQRMFGRKRT